VEKRGALKDAPISKYGTRATCNKNKVVKYKLRWWRDICKVCGQGNSNSWFHRSVVWKVDQVVK